MRRLTERSGCGGGTVYLNTDSATAREKLARYEDLGLEPEEIKKLLPDLTHREAAENTGA